MKLDGASRAREAAQSDEALQWEVLHVRTSGPWACVLTINGQRGYGLFEPTTGALAAVTPEEDRVLKALPRWMSRGELVNYRVGRRAVVRADVDGCVRYVKLMSRARARQLLRRIEAAERARAQAAPEFPVLAEVVDTSDKDGVLVFEALKGVTLQSLGTTGPLEEPVLFAVARALAAFHAVPAAGFDLPAAGERALATWAAAVEAVYPQLSEPFRTVLAAIDGVDAGTGETAVLVHGDVHDKNLFIDGDRVGMLDLDQLHAGDPSEDVGNLAGHLVLRALQRGEPEDRRGVDAERFLNAYVLAGGSSRRPEAVVARTLFRLACLYQLRRAWQSIPPMLLEEASRWAERAHGREGRSSAGTS